VRSRASSGDHLRRFAALVSGTYLAVVDAGEVGGPDFFPRSRVGGVEVGLGGAFAIAGGLEARLHLEWRRYFHAMLPEVGDRVIAGGAVDDFYAATLAVAYRQ